jgi:hypothetical protein
MYNYVPIVISFYTVDFGVKGLDKFEFRVITPNFKMAAKSKMATNWTGTSLAGIIRFRSYSPFTH